MIEYMKVAILAYGVEGKSGAAYWGAMGHDMTVCDANTELDVPSGLASQLGPDYLKGLDQFDLIMRTPSIRPDAITAANPDAPDILGKVTSTTREFMAHCPAPIIGVTGTKGKGTTSTLIAEMLRAAGKTVHLGGNIGKVPLDFLADVQPDHVVVLELSSFQLIDITQGPRIAVGLMISPDHLNWHTSMEEYVAAKGNIFALQEPDDTAVYFSGNELSMSIGRLSPGRQIPYFDPAGGWVDGEVVRYQEREVCRVDQVGLIGPHNLQNVCAALTAAWQITPDARALGRAIREFRGLEHRIELLSPVAGVSFVDDSFSVQPEAAVAAIASFDAMKVLILGGSDKGSPYEHLAQVVAAANIRRVILIGATAKALARDLEKAGYTNYVFGPGSMPEIVALAHTEAHKGDVVLLSPGCASFDMFRDYKDRGNQFKACVEDMRQ
jgi:UDP-N-acetylmuramoylalanine--D-glutamate ligase